MIAGLVGNDRLAGDTGRGDFLIRSFDPGADGDDTLSGGDDADTLVGGTGADVFAGGPGSDTATFADDHGNPTVVDNRRVPGEGVVVTIGAGARDDGNSTDGPEGARDDVRADVENVVGSGPFDFEDGLPLPGDTLIGDDGPNRLDGGAGPDEIDGGGGDDTLHGGSERARDGADATPEIPPRRRRRRHLPGDRRLRLPELHPRA